MPTVSPLPPDSISAVAPQLQASVDALLALYAGAKLAHWNVKGPLRMPLHLRFGDLADAAADHADSAAERIFTLGGSISPSTFDAAPIADPSGLALCKTIAAQIRKTVVILSDARDAANDHGDLDTLDLLTDAVRALEKIGGDVLAHLT